ncbi:ABC transporter ATP-binding protein [Desulfoluna spongiiphila]|uniref:ATP-binding cassette, subfamily B n=1 Tax=Desulfoluna spongiiphila TaxID=419481 RepID=A0A1G5H5M3_9BACT|nr:ABC transporter ATP-binding protein [Desulfoluna spongiiphila]SCY58961.1 ATP-binding cassette, subfamily B [Desulfoluna spongiiphila]
MLFSCIPPWLRLLSGYASRYRLRVAAGIGCSMAARVCDLLPMALVGLVINRMTTGTPAASEFVFYGLAVFSAFGGLAVFQSTSDYLLATIAQSIRHDIRMKLFAKILHIDTEIIEAKSKGDLLSVVTNDVDVLNGFFSETIANIVRVVISFAGTYGYLFWLDYRLALILAFPLPLIVACMRVFSHRIHPQYLKSRRAVGSFAGILENSLQGIPVLQAYCAEQSEMDRLKKESALYRDTAVDAAKTKRNFIPFIYAIAGISFGLLIGGGGWLTQLPGGPDLGAYTTFVLMGMRLVVPIFTLTFLINQLQQARAATLRVRELLSITPRLADLPDAMDLDDLPETVSFEKIRFHYPDHPELFSDISFTINKGEFIGIAGPTGAGKSSLIKLLLRFYGPSSGRIAINGKNLEELAAASFRKHVGYVSQHPFLFHGTVRDNLCLGSPKATEEEIRQAIRQAGIEEMIHDLPQGLHTILGDQGNSLSGGQKQRLSLARALLRDPEVLILDEATSAVDPLTESIIHTNILNLRKNRIIIAIAHRLSTLTACDRILVMARGGIVQEGPHQDLVAEEGVYRSLWHALQDAPC